MCAVSPIAPACSPDPCRARRARSSSPASSRSAARRSTPRGKRRKRSTAGATATSPRSRVCIPCAYDSSVAKLIHDVRGAAAGRAADDRPGRAPRRRQRRAVRAQSRRRDRAGQRGDAAKGCEDLARGRRNGSRRRRRCQIARAIREAGIPARVVAQRRRLRLQPPLLRGARIICGARSSPIPAVFVHLPATPEQTPPGASAARLTPAKAARARSGPLRQR